jgi:predicted XRE-type DNA-binding protein
VSHLMNGHFSRFTADKLLDFLKRLDQKVTIQIRPHKAGEPYQEVAFGT